MIDNEKRVAEERAKEKIRKKKRIRDYIEGRYPTSDARVQYRLVGINPTDQTQISVESSLLKEKVRKKKRHRD